MIDLIFISKDDVALQGISLFSHLFLFFFENVHPPFSGGFSSIYRLSPCIPVLHLYVSKDPLRYLSHQDPFGGGRESC